MKLKWCSNIRELDGGAASWSKIFIKDYVHFHIPPGVGSLSHTYFLCAIKNGKVTTGCACGLILGLFE
jgi:hypothetical protein